MGGMKIDGGDDFQASMVEEPEAPNKICDRSPEKLKVEIAEYKSRLSSATLPW